MTAFPAAVSSTTPVAAFDDDAWADLLNFVEEKQVIPIVGPELAIAAVSHSPTPSTVRIAASSKGEGKKALAACASWCPVKTMPFR